MSLSERINPLDLGDQPSPRQVVRGALKQVTDQPELLPSNEHIVPRRLKSGIRVDVHIVDLGDTSEVYCESEFGHRTTSEIIVDEVDELEDVVRAQMLELERDLAQAA